MQFLRMCVLVGTLMTVPATQASQATKPSLPQVLVFLGRFAAAAGLTSGVTVAFNRLSPQAGLPADMAVLVGTGLLSTLFCFMKDINTPDKTVGLFAPGSFFGDLFGHIELPAVCNWFNAITITAAAAVYGTYKNIDALYKAYYRLESLCGWFAQQAAA